MELYKRAAAGALTAFILTAPAFARDPANDPLPDPAFKLSTLDSTTRAEVNAACSFYSGALEFVDDNHFTGKTTVSQSELAEAAVQAILQKSLASEFARVEKEGGQKPQFVLKDPEQQSGDIAVMTVNGTTVNASAPPAAMSSYKDQCEYIASLAVPLGKETGTPIFRMFEYALNGALHASRDPHTSYMWNEAFRDMQIQTKGEFGGLGIEVGMGDDGLVKIISPYEDNPAAKAGLKAGDKIAGIDGEDVKGMTLDQAVQKMRGLKGDPITLTIQRGDEEPFDVELVRDTIVIHPVSGALLEEKPDAAVVKIKTFSEKTTIELIATIERLKKEAIDKGTPLQHLTLDLRNDPGGLLDEAKSVADLFIKGDNEVAQELYDQLGEQYDAALREGTSDGRARAAELGAEMSKVVSDYKAGKYPDKPLVAVGHTHNDDVTYSGQAATENYADMKITVLVNEGSASASEIVAGALQDNGIPVVGKTSFGKGSVQTIIPIGPSGKREWKTIGALRLTTGAFFPGNGLSNQNSGVKPNTLVENGDFRDEYAANARREANLDRALLPSDQTRESMVPSYVCHIKPEFSGALSAETQAVVPKDLIVEFQQRNKQTNKWEPIKMLDGDVACALGDSRFTTTEDYVAPAPAAPGANGP